MKRFKAWVASVWAAAKIDEKKLRRWLTAIGVLVFTAGYQVFDVGVEAIVAMDLKQLAKRFVVCLAMGLLGALVHGGPFKALVAPPVPEPLPLPTATAPPAAGATSTTLPPASPAP